MTVDNPLGWAYIDGGVRLVCTTPHTGVRVYDAAGRLIRLIPQVSDNAEILLTPGAYIITTDQQRSPLRVLVRQ